MAQSNYVTVNYAYTYGNALRRIGAALMGAGYDAREVEDWT
jgi:hypothetical protein